MAISRIDIGLDAGGSKTHLLRRGHADSERIERQGPAANLQRTGPDAAVDILASLVRAALAPYPPIDTLSVCAGVAGAGRRAEQDALADLLRRALADEATEVLVEVVHDACIALDAAFGDGSGVVVIAGTGSVVCGRTRTGSLHRVGGWGHRLGDDGSGHAIGRAGLRAVAEAFDGGRETRLQSLLCERFDVEGRDSFIHLVYEDNIALQDAAPLVVDAAEQGDAVASEILTTQAAKLARQVEWLLHQTDTVAPRVALLGGVMQNDSYRQRLCRSLLDRFPDWTVGPQERTPAEGALRRARALSSP